MYLIGADLSTITAKTGAFDEERRLPSHAIQKYHHPGNIEEANPQVW